MVTTLSGLVGGLLGAAAMTVAATVARDSAWPSAVVWAMYFGDGDPGNYRTPGLAVHLVYGTLAGAAFAALVGEPGPATLVDALVLSVGWAVVLAAVAAGFWLHLLVGAELDRGALVRMADVHLAYGAVLGLVVHAFPGL